MKSFLLILSLFSAYMALGAPVTLPNVTDSKLNLLFNHLAGYRHAPVTPAELNATQGALNALLGAMGPAIKNLTGYTGIFSGNCSVFFENTIKSAACDLGPATSRAIPSTAEFTASKQLPKAYWGQIALSHILLATVFADWRNGTAQDCKTDLYFKQGTCSDTYSNSNSASTSPSASLSESPTPTKSWLQSITESLLGTRSTSHTQTASQSLSETPTLSPPELSQSSTRTKTGSSTSTKSPTNSLTESLSASQDTTATSSISNDRTHSISLTQSASPSRTQTSTNSPTLVRCTTSTPPNTGVLSAWNASTGVYADATNQTGRYSVFNGTVTDSLTGIQWEQAVSAGTYSFSDAASYCGNQTTGGLSGWRVPNIGELQTLVDYTVNTSLPAIGINSTAFPGASSADIWSATSRAGATGDSWSIIFSDYAYQYYGSVATLNKVRCVRSCYSIPLAIRYTAASGEVTDKVTGLIWQQASPAMGGPNSDGTYQQSGARGYCAGLGLNGHNWRLPTARELGTLVDYSFTSSTLMMDALFTGPLSLYWTSTIQSSDSIYGWTVRFNGGTLGNYNFLSPGYVRCVR